MTKTTEKKKTNEGQGRAVGFSVALHIKDHEFKAG